MTAIITFGRMSPCTRGHRKLATKLEELGRSVDADMCGIYLSRTHDGESSKKPGKKGARRNPLSYESKIKYVKDMVSHLDVSVPNSEAKTIYEVLPELYQGGFTEVYLMVGDDREDEFSRVFTYNGDKSLPQNRFFEFKTLEVLSAGARDENSNDPDEQASATLLRQCVYDLDYDRFESFAGTQSLTEEMFEECAYELGVELD